MSKNRSISRRRLVSTIGASVAAGLAGCSDSSDRSEATNTSGKEGGSNSTTQGERLNVASWGGDVESDIVTSILEDYDSSNPNVNVKYQNIPFGEYSTKLKTQFSGGTEPEVFYLASGSAPQYMQNSALLALDSYVENSDNYAYDDILDNLLSAFQYQGKTYGIPKDFTPVGLFMNESHLEEAGANTSPETWSGFRSALEAVKTSTDVEYPFAFGSRPRNTLVQLIWQNGGRILSEDNSECVVGSTAAIEALQYLLDLRSDGLAAIYGNEISPTWAAPSLGKERVTAAMTGAWSISTLKEEYGSVSDSLKVANPMPIPNGGQQSTIVFTTSWSASAQQETKQASAALVKSLTSKEGMWKWTKTGTALPARRSLLEKDFYDDRPLLNGLGNLADDGRPFLFGIHHSEVVDTVMSEVEGAVTGAKSPDAALKDAERQLNSDVF
ncbi:ABC transporter substrate-binding protein [Haloarcula pellucida]|uniref:ABC transporter substrate-binding protein n=1 Tax=Haloarcula pellucida TaxID=1427151 RepID=A0A830GKX1_9EURY|nr:sugar ABC transporter substrate-binding protein [Halomicroarcula pellucida]GGN95709.1 ABC transporter substrate-binding protein [Halomicroarcula pellucida]